MNKNMNIIRSILSVKRVEYLNPHYIRVTLTGEEVALFKNASIGANNKIFLPSTVDGEIYFDPEKSVRRTYTHRGIDLEKKEMYIDFVAHADSGPASLWAAQAKPGDKLGVAMKNSASDLYPQADWYLLAADASGIPVVAAILESLPATAKGVARVEVPGPEEELPLSTAADISIEWVHNPFPGEGTPVATAVRKIRLPERAPMGCFAYVAAEFSTVKEIRKYFRKELGWGKEELYAYSYWKAGKSEDGSVLERQEEKRSFSEDSAGSRCTETDPG